MIELNTVEVAHGPNEQISLVASNAKNRVKGTTDTRAALVTRNITGPASGHRV